jgi:RNA polymerase sigma-70 factor, ECF subfamily
MSRFATEADLVRGLQARDEAAFRELIRRFHPHVVSVARMHVSTQASAEEVAQETWIGVLKGIDRFEGRSSLKTWLFRIASNRAKTRGLSERRATPFSSAGYGGDDGPAFDPDLFDSMGTWRAKPSEWGIEPSTLASGSETLRFVGETLLSLPDQQREVVMLRDQQGMTSAEVCDALGITEANQRVLLHRGRHKLRVALDAHFAAGETV